MLSSNCLQIVCKVTKKRVQNKKNLFFFMPSASNFGFYANVTKKREQNKKNLFFFYIVKLERI